MLSNETHFACMRYKSVHDKLTLTRCHPSPILNYAFFSMRASVRKKKKNSLCADSNMYYVLLQPDDVCKMRVMKRNFFIFSPRRRKYGKIKMCVTTLLSLLSYALRNVFVAGSDEEEKLRVENFMIVYLKRRRRSCERDKIMILIVTIYFVCVK